MLVISQDLDELFAICDRIGVISEGRLAPPRPTASLDAQALGLLMGGVHGAGTVATADGVPGQ